MVLRQADQLLKTGYYDTKCRLRLWKYDSSLPIHLLHRFRQTPFYQCVAQIAFSPARPRTSRIYSPQAKCVRRNTIAGGERSVSVSLDTRHLFLG